LGIGNMNELPPMSGRMVKLVDPSSQKLSVYELQRVLFNRRKVGN